LGHLGQSDLLLRGARSRRLFPGRDLVVRWARSGDRAWHRLRLRLSGWSGDGRIGLLVAPCVVQRFLCVGVGVIVDGDAVVRCKSGQSRVVALSDGTELPLFPTPVQLTEDDRAHGAGVIDGELEEVLTASVSQRHPQLFQFSETSPVVPARCYDDPADA